MEVSEHLTAIEAYEVEGLIAVPYGTRLVYFHHLDGRKIAHVEHCSAEKLYDQNLFDLYRLADAEYLSLKSRLNGVPEIQDWWHNFKEPVQEAGLFQGKWKTRSR